MLTPEDKESHKAWTTFTGQVFEKDKESHKAWTMGRIAISEATGTEL